MPKEFIAKITAFKDGGDFGLPSIQVEPNPASFAFDKVQIGDTVRVEVVEQKCADEEAPK